MIDRQLASDLIALVAEELRERGYTVVLEPGASALPPFLRDLRPDGVALGKSPNLVIEVATEGTESTRRVSALTKALVGEPDWELHLILNRGRTAEEPAVATMERVDHIVASAARVAADEPMAALILCWASLEALARAIEPKTFARAQTPGRIIERLAAQGYIVAGEANFLRAMAMKRNSFVHGDLNVMSAPVEIEQFVELLRSLGNVMKEAGRNDAS